MAPFFIEWGNIMSPTYNHLDNVKFKFQIARLPSINYWVQSCILPSVTIESSYLPGAKRDIPVPGHKPSYENLIINFIVDQNLTNYEEVLNWFNVMSTSSSINEMVSDCTLHFLDGDNRTTRSIDFVGAYPTLVTELSMNSDDTDVIPVTCSVSFNYAYFKFTGSKSSAWV